MPPRTRRALVAGSLLHTLAVLWIWYRWAPGIRGPWLIWVDLPWSLLWVHQAGRRLLWLSLTVGGAWWGVLTAGVNWAVARLVARR